MLTRGGVLTFQTQGHGCVQWQRAVAAATEALIQLW